LVLLITFQQGPHRKRRSVAMKLLFSCDTYVFHCSLHTLPTRTAQKTPLLRAATRMGRLFWLHSYCFEPICHSVQVCTQLYNSSESTCCYVADSSNFLLWKVTYSCLCAQFEKP
jgi:hypothetical protein